MRKESEALQKFKKCVDQCVHDWNRTTLSDIEKWSYEEWFIWGVAHTAIYFLSFDEYHKFINYIKDTYGYNIQSDIEDDDE